MIDSIRKGVVVDGLTPSRIGMCCGISPCTKENTNKCNVGGKRSSVVLIKEYDCIVVTLLLVPRTQTYTSIDLNQRGERGRKNFTRRFFSLFFSFFTNYLKGWTRGASIRLWHFLLLYFLSVSSSFVFAGTGVSLSLSLSRWVNYVWWRFCLY